jgi:uncharacterized protein (TIGR02391 family)
MAIDRKAIIRDLIQDAQEMKLCEPSDDPDEITAVSSAYYYLLTQIQAHAARILPQDSANELRTLRVEINDIYSVYETRAKFDALIPDILDAMEKDTMNGHQAGFEGMLHPSIVKNCYQQYCDGHLRESVLNSIVSIFDLIRSRTGIDADGASLVDRAFSLSDPYLVLSDLTSESGLNDQKGFIQIFKGSYQGIRNPKAHTLNHDLTEAKAAQYLVFASLLARRIEEATCVKGPSSAGG